MIDFIKAIHFTSDTWVFLAPCIMIALDFLSGLVKAWSTKTFKSEIMRKGLTNKFYELIILLVVELFSVALGLPKYILSFTSLYLMYMELMSINENLNKMGVKIPKFIKNVLDSTDQALSNDDYAALQKKAEALQKELDELKK